MEVFELLYIYTTMKNSFIKSFSEFSQKLNENKILINFRNPKTFDELQNLGTYRWLPCRSYNLKEYKEKIENGCYYIYLDNRNYPIFLLDSCDKSIIDFDNKEYTNVSYYEYLSNYPDVLDYIKFSNKNIFTVSSSSYDL
jgi:hypothetical protein